MSRDERQGPKARLAVVSPKGCAGEFRAFPLWAIQPISVELFKVMLITMAHGEIRDTPEAPLGAMGCGG